MTDPPAAPTPEEITRFCAHNMLIRCSGTATRGYLTPVDCDCECHGMVRAAVAAERERCAKVNCVAIECPQCGAEPGDYCAKMYAVHEARWWAAIRAEVKDD